MTSGIDGEASGDSLKTIPNQVASIFGKKSKQVPDTGIVEGMKVEDVERLVSIRSITDMDAEGPSPKAWYAARETSSGAEDLLGTMDDVSQKNNFWNKKGSKQDKSALSSSTAQKSTLQSKGTSEEKALYRGVLDIWVSFRKKKE
jgi:hypothetical protein